MSVIIYLVAIKIEKGVLLIMCSGVAGVKLVSRYQPFVLLVEKINQLPFPYFIALKPHHVTFDPVNVR